MFENHINHNNSYHIESEQVWTCLRIASIHIILNLKKFRHVSTGLDLFETCMNCNNSYDTESEQV